MIAISSFSFKGGSGRTSSTANLAVALAKKGKNVCLIDMDLEGAGLSVILGLRKYLKNVNMTYIQDYFVDEYPDDFNYRNMILNVNEIKSYDTVKWMKLKGTLLFIPARIEFDDKTKINYNNDAPAKNLTLLLNMIEQDQDLTVDYVILDSASGYCDAFYNTLKGILDYKYHLLLLFTRWSQQHIAGTIKVSRHFNDENEKNNRINYEVIANVIPYLLFDNLGNKFEDITKYIESEIGKSIFTFIPENDDMKWNERIMVFDDVDARNADVINAYNHIADQIISKY